MFEVKLLQCFHRSLGMEMRLTSGNLLGFLHKGRSLDVFFMRAFCAYLKKKTSARFPTSFLILKTNTNNGKGNIYC